MQKMLSVLKKKIEGRGSQIDFKWFQEQKVLGRWLDWFFKAYCESGKI